jgi:hypothetical protein
MNIILLFVEINTSFVILVSIFLPILSVNSYWFLDLNYNHFFFVHAVMRRKVYYIRNREMEEKTNEIFFFFYTSDVFNFPIEFIFFSFIWFGKQKKHTKYNYFFDANLLIQSDCEFFLLMKIFEDKKKSLSSYR